jgi:hypothetical protein
MSDLTKLQNELKAPKNQRNHFGKYNYRSCEDILEAVKPLLEKYSLTLTITDQVRECTLGSYIEASAIIEKDSKVIARSDAQAGIEKAGGMALPQAFGSASSYARKYALNGLFLIDDTKDADSTNNHAPMKKERAIELLAQAVDIKALQAAWKMIASEDVATNKDVVALKDIRKTELTPTK